jgi:hypothetical protein
VQPSDLQGVARLATNATVGIVDLVERVHHTIAQRSGIVGPAPAGRTRGITGLVYRSVRGTAWLSGRAADAVLGAIARQLPAGDADPAALPSAAREAALAVLNGLWGDHLAASANPLAIPMQLRTQGRPLVLQASALAQRFPQASGRLVVLAHGLCMNDLQWARNGHDHGQALARDGHRTALYLHYNTGRHVPDNGLGLAQALEALVAHWPVPVTELVLVGHSMGGLVLRSACHQAQLQGLQWPRHLRAMALLGTPHHGAPLERGGRWLDRALDLSPYAAPFARLGRTRSAGITDLRFGNVLPAGQPGQDRHAQARDDRVPTPLPPGVPVYLMAATLAGPGRSRHPAALGDGLVPLDSALGRHPDPALDLAVPPERHRVLHGVSHWDLLSHPAAFEQLRQWLR